jgi:sulfotransferase
MTKTFYFIAGLPRSGSTLLSAILNQNPRFYSGPNSPVIAGMMALESAYSNNELFLSYPKIQQGKDTIASILPQFYSDRTEPVIFDKNRSWTSRLHYISGYFDIVPKIICPVRDVSEILASFISLIDRNPYVNDGKINFIDEMLIKNNESISNENRCKFLMSSNGILGQSHQSLKDALMNGFENNLHFVEYNDLVSNPQESLNKIYEFLGETPFNHHYDNLENKYKTNDLLVYGLPDMHEVRPNLSKTSQSPTEILPESIIKSCEGLEFWRLLND